VSIVTIHKAKGKLRVGKELFEPLPPNELAGWE
jgi:hypothetical protein